MGKTKAEVAAGAVVLRALPKSVQSTAARRRRETMMMREPIEDPFAAQWIELGTVVVAAGQTITHEVRLPPSFGQVATTTHPIGRGRA